jgi:histidinol-phosphate aminotransferase
MMNLNILARSALSKLQPYSPGKPIWEVQEELGLDRVIKLASNENPLGASPKAQEAIHRYVSDIHRYPDANAIKLREAIASHYDVVPNQVIVGNGADELITLISEAFLEEGDEVIVPWPSFTEYEFGAHLMGAKVVYTPLSSAFEYDVETILGLITDRNKLIYICSPNNPTGTYMKRNSLERLLSRLPRTILVVLDGAYSHYVDEEDYTNGIEYIKNNFPIILLQTFSKIYGLAGIRVGFGLSTPEIIETIHKVREPFNVNMLAKVASTAALGDEDHVNQSKKINEEGRRFLYGAFAELGISYTASVSNFILVEIGAHAKWVYEQLLKQGIILRYAGVWRLPNHLRVTIGLEEENRALINALKSIL